ncbi:MAG: HD domain-containing protein [Bacteroidetes bacterium]|nr:HD domain-containing protein [Bacteroidota bacterium]
MEQIWISQTIDFVKNELQNAEAGHDWFHIERVWKLSKIIANTEKCNTVVVELAALLHDIAEPKFHNGDETLALSISRNFLEKIKVPNDIIVQVLYIIENISFKNKSITPENHSVELQIVQDADRLDALGAIGIARTFHFGGYRNNLIYHPEIAPNLQMTKDEYKKSNGTTINHFYEKLLLLKDLMNTQKGKAMAEQRHQYLQGFLQQFLDEWHLD